MAVTRIYTVGHSRHPIDVFLTLLDRHGIELVVDTRGQPYSRFSPQFNRETLKRSLIEHDIAYRWHGDRLSGRPTESRFYALDGTVRWEELRRWPALIEELDRVSDRAASSTVALLCAEEDPRRCHRRFLLTPVLVERGCEVQHIRGDGRVESEAQLAAEDAANSGADQLDLFGD